MKNYACPNFETEKSVFLYNLSKPITFSQKSFLWADKELSEDWVS